MLRNISFLIVILIFALSGCQQDANSESASSPYPAALAKALDAHGGLDRWKSMHTLKYTMMKSEKPEMHQVDLHSRKVRIAHEDYTIGFDGQDAWVAPNKEAFGNSSARFYHNLYFYFFALPYLAADPGIIYEELPVREFNGKTYDVVKIGYEKGIGDAPDDEYIMHFDQETGLMHLLLYTVTYYSKEKSDRFNAIIYDDWIDVEGLKLPGSFKGFKYANDELGEMRYERVFVDHYLSEEPLVDSTFDIPAVAEIDSLIL